MMKVVADIIKPIFTRIDSSANWKTLNPVPKNGEQCIEVLNGGLFKLKIGDGVTPWIALKYWTSDNDVNVRDIQVDGVSVVDNEKIANIDLTGKIDHFEVMPEIIEEMDNLIVQYVGETDTDYINGYWYKAHYDFTNPRNCYWEQIKIQSDEDKQDKDYTEVYKVGFNGGWETANTIINTGSYVVKTDNENGSTTLSIDNIIDNGSEITDDNTGLTTGRAVYEYVDIVANNKVDKTNIINQLYGTDENGDQTTYDLDLFGSVNDVQLHGQSIVTNKIANIELEASDVEYTNEQYPSMQTIQDAMDRLLYITPTISITGGGNYEIGSTRATTTLTWNWNKTIISQSLNQGIGSLDPTLRTYTYNIPITSNTTFTISGTDGITPKSASTSITFLPKRYWGVSVNTSLTDADILGLSQELSTSRTQTRTFDCSGGKYFYFVIRTSYCNDISFKVNGLVFSDMDLETRNVVNAQGYSASYNIYRAHNIQTGSGIEVQVL